jgi:hypothetical protein
MANFVIRHHRTKKFWGFAVANSMAILWDLVDSRSDPYLYEFAELEHELILFGDKLAFPETDLHKIGEGDEGDIVVKINAWLVLNTAEMQFHRFDPANRGCGMLALIAGEARLSKRQRKAKAAEALELRSGE